MNLKTFSEENVRRSNLLFREQCAPENTIVFLMGAMEELGEVAEAIKKGHSIDELSDEIADVVTYLDLLATSRGIDLSDALVRKFNKVSMRKAYPHTI